MNITHKVKVIKVRLENMTLEDSDYIFPPLNQLLPDFNNKVDGIRLK